MPSMNVAGTLVSRLASLMSSSFTACAPPSIWLGVNAELPLFART